jgi:ABC-type multidrug transport system fused ATPase/permease subunit
MEIYRYISLCLSLSYSDKMPPQSWPSEGAIRFDKLYLRYSKTEGHVLKNLTFAIEAKQKVCELIWLPF